ncbi:TPA: penicillin-binding protein activator [Kluyvera intermedia]|uniref:Penicillin-binding protein activator LpoA n=2 Tax=Enterobacteriaceae TaxID=543 RepID=A0AAC8TQG2_9ENTR|nr:penicillin-binding protein activator [Phytobacter ursingii]HAT2205690.1 penicillin-binding protein activator [Kluyvera intermedia]AKL14993.1 penicillin-binding protein [Phytobacter ursingii]HAT2516416.1 penicillin-binding protein activator [Kluyvera intermedia]HAT2604161.1 penicillin-binding protein activator [Kluyvera intermedia]HAT2681136.1 penicillin-binding protein activator [Kluyvera intermedia]
MLPSTFLRSKAMRCLPVVLAALLFAGCGTHPVDQSTGHLEGKAQADSGFYLHQMQQSSDDSKTNWQLLAIRALLKEGRTQQASELLAQLPQELNDEQRAEQTLLSAELKLTQQDYAGAQALLSKVDLKGFSQNQQARYWQDVITASQNKPSPTLLRALIAQQPLLTAAPDKQKNIDATWQALSSLTPDQTNAIQVSQDETVLQGWLDLQRVWSNNRNDPNMLKAGIADWQKRFPQNPGAVLLPSQLANVQNFRPASVNQIALLLPLNGQAAVFSRAIQQGFEAAKNGTTTVSGPAVPVQVAQAATMATTADVVSPAQTNVSDLTTPQSAPAAGTSPVTAPAQAQAQADQTQQTPPAVQPSQPSAEQTDPAAPAGQPVNTPAVASTPANPSAVLKVYDTSSQPLDQVLSQVQKDGASIVVGPLLKNHVEELMRSQTPLNVLALNQPEKVENRPNICYFALSPEDEARDAARHIHQQGRHTPLLLLPRSSLGDRVANAFAQEWQKLGGSIVLQQKFGSTTELRMGINSGSGIAMTGSPVTASLPQQQGVTIGGLNIPAPPTEAQITGGGNIDAVYIVATQDEIALIKPMIAMRTGSQSGIVLYASSRSAQGGSGPDFRLEMEGLQFSEIPMLAGSNPALMQQALMHTNNDYSLARLYAMGADAWTLANHFSQMRQVPGFEINGNTGDLTATQECVINRKLSWLKYQQGQIFPAS